MNAFASWALARLQEPSTYAGITAFVAGLTFIPAADLALATKIITLAATVIPGLLAIVLAEGSAPKANS